MKYIEKLDEQQLASTFQHVAFQGNNIVDAINEMADYTYNGTYFKVGDIVRTNTGSYIKIVAIDMPFYFYTYLECPGQKILETSGQIWQIDMKLLEGDPLNGIEDNGYLDRKMKEMIGVEASEV